MTLFSTLLGENVPLITALLNSWLVLDAGNAVPYVEALSEGKYIAASRPDILDHASSVLPALRKRQSQLKAIDHLLRPAKNEVVADVLVRPAARSSGADADNLLHSVDDQQ